MGAPDFVVGIDLGTTHSALAAARLDRPTVEVALVPQLVAPGEVATQPLLPSFLYLPAHGELLPDDIALPWGRASVNGSERVVGELARKLGAKVPMRLVASAKSWVCHGGINRRAPILPWNAPDDAPHVSPYEAQVAYLAHLRAAWDHAHPDAPLRQQDVIVTVPASFDEGAREVTSHAAEAAGLGSVRLLEEPQAAFYDVLGAHAEHGEHVDPRLSQARLILVIDVGGGTTDLTLLRVLPPAEGSDGRPVFERIAVGGHLMLGGDNMDAALAQFAVAKVGIDRSLDATEWSALVQSARDAKERLLARDAPPETTISFQTRGSKLMGNTRSILVRREEVLRLLLDGFLPITQTDEVVDRSSRAGLTTLGLPYASDAAIPRHLAAFLRRHAEAAAAAGAHIENGLPRPDLLLLNGGVFNAPAIVERLHEVLSHWYGGSVPSLEHTSLEVAVARGAVRYGLARRGIGELIGGGTARAYYIGVQGPNGEPEALCVAPRGMADGSSVEVPNRVFDLLLDRPIMFPLYGYTGARIDGPGALVRLDEPGNDEALEPLPALQTVLRAQGDARSSNAVVPVTLSATLTDTGALELYLVTVELPPRRWKLDFALQQGVEPEAAKAKAEERKAAQPETPLHRRFPEARRLFERVFASDDPKKVKSIRSDMEQLLGPRGEWSARTCRAVWEACMDARRDRGRTYVHELNWLRLCGFGLRPGFGVVGDEDRLATTWSLRDEGLLQPTKANWAEWWILWRRVAAGLDRERQLVLFEDVRPWLWPPPKPPHGPRAHGMVEMIQLLAALERIPAEIKKDVGELCLERADKVGSYWPLGRVGARVLFTAEQGQGGEVVSPEIAEGWLTRLLELDWGSAEGASFAAASIARLTGDPARDIDGALRAQVIDRLRGSGAPATWIDMLMRPSDLSEGDMKRVFGDSLPVGLRLT